MRRAGRVEDDAGGLVPELGRRLVLRAVELQEGSDHAPVRREDADPHQALVLADEDLAALRVGELVDVECRRRSLDLAVPEDLHRLGDRRCTRGSASRSSS